MSLPNLKIRKRDEKIDREKRKAKKRKGQNNLKPLKKNREDEWDEIFFHYFEEYLQRFIEEKEKKRHKVIVSRSRIMSEDISDYL